MLNHRESVLGPRPAAPELPASADDEYVVEAAQGNAVAFGHLYKRYLPGVYRYMAARAASPEEAADLTQQVFLNAFRGLARYQRDGAFFAPWLFRIARNTATDASRRRRRQLLLDGANLLTAPSLDASPEMQLIRSEHIRQLHAAVALLAPARQELLALRFAAGLSSREIAAVTGKSEAAVKKALTRAMQTLKETYRDSFSADA